MLRWPRFYHRNSNLHSGVLRTKGPARNCCSQKINAKARLLKSSVDIHRMPRPGSHTALPFCGAKNEKKTFAHFWTKVSHANSHLPAGRGLGVDPMSRLDDPAEAALSSAPP